MNSPLPRKLWIILALMAMIPFARSQDFLPFANDNFTGITQVGLQPASIADSRNLVDINLVGLSMDFKNDMFRFNKISLNALPWEYINPNWWQDNTTLKDPNGKPKNAYASGTVMGPGFMIAPTSKLAFAFTTKARAFVNAENIDEPLAGFIYDNTNTRSGWNQWGTTYKGEDLNVSSALFAEYGIGFASEIFYKGDHYLKGGATLKLLQGLGAAYTSMESYEYAFDQTGAEEGKLLDWQTDHAYLGMSDNWEDTSVNVKFKYKFISNPGVGLDLGIVYEWRRDSDQFRYDMDGKTGLIRRDLNKYILKVGVSVLDIGRIRYKNTDIVNISDFSSDIQNLNLDEVNLGAPTPYYGFAQVIEDHYGSGTTPKESDDYFNMRLPTAFSLQVDYRVIENFYLNLTTFTALNQGNNHPSRSHYLSMYSFTPRYETRWFGASLPICINQYKNFGLGLGLRLGILYIGTNDILGLLGLVNHYGPSLSAALKIPIFQKKPPSDIDHDGVSDEKDKCPTVPGVWEFKGCPDKDGDGVPDNEDLCPDDPGLVEYRGCPDRDGDGIIDKLDDCPADPGLEQFNGCPDRDGDGIMDKLDQCPDEPGLAAFDGCPDTDGDGVPDKEDLCPTIPGLISMRGCPYNDEDGDGIKDEDDACPKEAGPIENRGCPYADTDGDGVLDKDDRCPLTPGDPQNFGCPVLKEEEKAVLRTAFENLEFETAKAIIRSSSFPSLDELANLLKSKPAYKLHIAGHTDWVGTDAYNMNLSKERAQSVSKYLQGKGVDPKQFVVEWFGETKPIADNNTAEGRQKNRRVEMEVIFD